MTPRQKNTLDVITDYINTNGYSPSYDDLKPLLGVASKSGVHRLVMQLVDRNKIKFMKYRARSIELING
tara:strand:+ start:345 stop:551 length:207 start_codon:yes stop_codon:yes gene_type:complete